MENGIMPNGFMPNGVGPCFDQFLENFLPGLCNFVCFDNISNQLHIQSINCMSGHA